MPARNRLLLAAGEAETGEAKAEKRQSRRLGDAGVFVDHNIRRRAGYRIRTFEDLADQYFAARAQGAEGECDVRPIDGVVEARY